MFVGLDDGFLDVKETKLKKFDEMFGAFRRKKIAVLADLDSDGVRVERVRWRNTPSDV